MVANPKNPAWRSMPCRFYSNNGSCTKGAECPFQHIDEYGVDIHQEALCSQGGEEHLGGGCPEDDVGETFGDDQVNELSEMADPYAEWVDEDYLIPHLGVYPGIEL